MSSKQQVQKLKMLWMRGPVFVLDHLFHEGMLYRQIEVFELVDSRRLIQADMKVRVLDEF